MTGDEELKSTTRTVAVEPGQPYLPIQHQLQTPIGQAPAVFTQQAEAARQWHQLVIDLQQAAAHVEHPDPYVRADALQRRSLLYGHLAVQTTDRVYAAACASASVLDERAAAEVSFLHGIPTLTPHRSRTGRPAHLRRVWPPLTGEPGRRLPAVPPGAVGAYSRQPP